MWNLVEACTCRTDIWKKAECMAKVSLSCRFTWYWVIACNLLYNFIDNTCRCKVWCKSSFWQSGISERPLYGILWMQILCYDLWDALSGLFDNLEILKNIVWHCVNTQCWSDVLNLWCALSGFFGYFVSLRKLSMASSNFIFSCSDVSTHDLVRGSVRLSLPKGMSFPWELPKVSDNCAPWKKVDSLECASQLQAKYPNVPIQALNKWPFRFAYTIYSFIRLQSIW